MPFQFGVAKWLYIVAWYQANGQPLEKSVPVGNRPMSVLLNESIRRPRVRQSAKRASRSGGGPAARSTRVTTSDIVGITVVGRLLPLVRSAKAAVLLRPSVKSA